MKVLAHGPAPGQAPAAAGTWLLPSILRDARSWSSRGRVVGQPGTMGVSAPAPAAVPQDYSRRLHGSQDAPNVIFPAVYYELHPSESAPVSRISDNQLPVPAISPLGKPGILSTPPPRIGGQAQVGQPYAVQNWPKFVATV